MRNNIKKIKRKVCKIFSDKSGSVFIESSIALPLVIFSVIFVIVLSVNYYVDLLYSIRADEKLNNSIDSLTSLTAKNSTNKFFGNLDKKVFSKEIKVKNHGTYLSQTTTHKYYLLSFFKNKHKNSNKGRKYIIDESEMVRNFIS